MRMTLQRTELHADCTIGELSIDGVFECYTLEPTVRPDGIKVQDQTAIAARLYEVTIDFSPRFGCLMPHILNVPDFEGVRMHVGNFPHNTDGCVLLGQDHLPGEGMIGHSEDAFKAFYPKLLAATTWGDLVTLTILNPEATA